MSFKITFRKEIPQSAKNKDYELSLGRDELGTIHSCPTTWKYAPNNSPNENMAGFSCYTEQNIEIEEVRDFITIQQGLHPSNLIGDLESDSGVTLIWINL